MLCGRSDLLAACATLFLLASSPALGQSPEVPPQSARRIILSFGNDQFIPKAAIETATGARFQSDFKGLKYLDEVSVIVLADIPLAQVDTVLQSRLADWVNMGGSLLFTGGNNAFGLGGYVGTSIGSILPLLPDTQDKTAHSFGPMLPIDQSHPVLAGITLTSMGFFNETRLAADATLISEYRASGKAGFTGAGMTGSGRTFVTTTNPATGQPQVTLGTPAQSKKGVVTNPVTGQTVQAGAGSGTASSGAGATGQAGVFPGTVSSGGTFNPGFASEGGIQGGGRLPWPLLAERRLGAGIVLATSLDLNATGEWQDRQSFVINMIRYLVHQSRLPQPG